MKKQHELATRVIHAGQQPDPNMTPITQHRRTCRKVRANTKGPITRAQSIRPAMPTNVASPIWKVAFADRASENRCFSHRRKRLPGRTAILESLPKLNEPEPAFDGGKRFVVVVLEGSGYKRWIGIEHVLDAKRQRRAI
jgi:hypothetical protein